MPLEKSKRKLTHRDKRKHTLRSIDEVKKVIAEVMLKLKIRVLNIYRLISLEDKIIHIFLLPLAIINN